jgi:hypothetical protein
MADKILFIGPCTITNGDGGKLPVAIVATPNGTVAVPLPNTPPPTYSTPPVTVQPNKK